MSHSDSPRPPRWTTFVPTRRRTAALIWRSLPEELGGLLIACEREYVSVHEGWPIPRDYAYEALLRHALRPGATFVDVGAHSGFFTLLGAHFTGPTGRVVAVEADPHQCTLLRQNLDRNRLSTVLLVPAAAAASVGAAGFVADPVAGPDDILLGERRVMVAARPLDLVLDELGIGTPSLLKMNIGGGEAQAVVGLERRLTAGLIDRLLVDLHPEPLEREGTSASELVEAFRLFGYSVWQVGHVPPGAPMPTEGDVRALLTPLEPGVDPGTRPRVWLVREGLDVLDPRRRSHAFQVR